MPKVFYKEYQKDNVKEYDYKGNFSDLHPHLTTLDEDQKKNGKGSLDISQALFAAQLRKYEPMIRLKRSETGMTNETKEQTKSD